MSEEHVSKAQQQVQGADDGRPDRRRRERLQRPRQATPAATTAPRRYDRPPARPMPPRQPPATSPSPSRSACFGPGATQEATDALNLQISEFEAKYPWVTVEPMEYNWTAPTFTAALAAGTLPDVFTIPFTDGKGLIAQHQIVNIDARVRALPLRRHVQQEHPRQRPGRKGPDLGSALSRHTACR